MTKVTIRVSTDATQEQFNKVLELVDYEEKNNINMQAFSLSIKWGEFTELESPQAGDGDLLNLYSQIVNILGQ